MTLDEFLNTVKTDAPLVTKIGEVLLDIAKVMPGIGNGVSAITMGIQIANGIVNAVPEVIATYEDIKTAAAGGAPVSDAQWTEWTTAVDAAHADFVAAASRVANQ